MYKKPTINSKDFHAASKKMREFFEGKGFIEAATQPRLSILAACEDPTTVSSFEYSGQVWPLKQTGQMDLEYELLTNHDYPGVFCQTTSYRQEKNPIPGRHDLIFPMFEFEAKGTMEDMIKLEKELLEHMGFSTEKYHKSKDQDSNDYVEYDYLELSEIMGVKEFEAEHEDKMGEEIAPAVFLKNFPEYTSPFWNMKRNDQGTANKVDVILYGIETIGSAERECDPEIMMDRFHKISDGEYAQLLFNLFGKERVMQEMEDFLNLPMIPRFGGGIGMTRMIRAMKLAEQENQDKQNIKKVV